MKKLQYFFIFSLLLILVTGITAKGQESEEYIIKKGDTLWDISDNELEDTYLWPKLWNVNPHIDNPDLIYPGSMIRIPSREELMRIAPVPMRRPWKQKSEARTVYKIPEQRKKKYIVDRDLFIKSGWIADRIPGIGEITYSPNNRMLLSKNEIAYLKMSSLEEASLFKKIKNPVKLIVGQEEIRLNDKFYSVREVKEVRHPDTGKKVGHQIRVTGILEVMGEDSDTPKAKITSTFEEVNVGDRLFPYFELEPPLVSDSYRTPAISGTIVESQTNSYLSPEGSIVFLDKGEKDGLKQGDMFAVFSGEPVDRVKGKIQVISLQPSTAGALVLESDQEILIGNKWGHR